MLNFIVIGTVAIVLLALFRRDYHKAVNTVIFVLIFMPINCSIDISESLPSFTIHRIVIMIWLVAWIRNRELDKKTRGFTYFRPIFILLIVIGISTIGSGYFLVSFKRYLYYFFESYLFFILLRSSIRDRSDIYRLFKTLSLALLCVGMNGIIERWTGVNFATYFGSKITYSFEASHTASPDDVTSTFLHRILFGTGMSVGMIMFFLFLDVPEFHQDRRKNWFFFFIVFAALYFSLSRGPWLSFAVALAVLMLIDGRIVITKIFGILMVLLMVVLIRPQVFDSIYGLFSATFDSTSIKGASYNWRFLVWKMAIERIIHSGNLFRIFFGFGRGSHIFMEFGRVTLSTGHVTQFLSWDSEFAILLYENGLTGVGVLIGLYVSFFRRSRRVYRMSKDKLMLVVLGIMIVLLFMKTNVSFFTPQLLYLEFICLAVSSYLIDRPSQALGDNDAFIAAK